MKGLGLLARLVAGLVVASVTGAANGESAEAARGVAVFVTTSTELHNGLIEKETADARQDLEGKLRQGRKNVRLAPNRETAGLVLVIAGRGVADSGAYIPGSSTTTVQGNTYNDTLTAKTTTTPDIPVYVTNVRADLYVSADGKHLRSFLGDGLTWKGAANDVAKQVDSWVGLNRQGLERMVHEAEKAALEKEIERAFRARYPDAADDLVREAVQLGTSAQITFGPDMTPGQMVEKLHEAVRLRRIELAFKARHPELTPELERQVVALGSSGEVHPVDGETPEAFLERLYAAVVARQAPK